MCSVNGYVDFNDLCCADRERVKRAGDTISLVLPYGIGDSRLYRIAVADLADFIAKGL